ncbi:DUF5363 family protein [Vibrio spartinae]|uniref:DUF5363 family protein n=1 Tax=Vibrio spartinae TaxID=1918945 RepID=A0A1N6M135_9VIBR|nr:DUF5363 family protein [Vibrio spartinae]QMV15294.1 hypothetical protein Vspart_02588 [Vibrio spartinae]SIO93164.1 hypothetical protein VSP9026_00813 [Vibrio spartinae]
MWCWLKRCLARYDSWCLRMGLTPAQKRSCVPYRSETTDAKQEHSQDR